MGSAPFVRRRCDCLASSAPFTNIQTYLLTYGLDHSKFTWGLPTMSLTIKGYRLPWQTFCQLSDASNPMLRMTNATKTSILLHHCTIWEDECHYLVILLYSTQLSLYIKPCDCRRTLQQDGIRAPAERDCQVVPGKHGPLRLILECHRALTGMPPFVVVMEEERYSLWRLHAYDDDDDDDDDDYVVNPLMHDFYLQGKTRLVLLLRTSGDWNETFFILIYGKAFFSTSSCL